MIPILTIDDLVLAWAAQSPAPIFTVSHVVGSLHLSPDQADEIARYLETGCGWKYFRVAYATCPRGHQGAVYALDALPDPSTMRCDECNGRLAPHAEWVTAYQFSPSFIAAARGRLADVMASP